MRYETLPKDVLKKTHQAIFDANRSHIEKALRDGYSICTLTIVYGISRSRLLNYARSIGWTEDWVTRTSPFTQPRKFSRKAVESMKFLRDTGMPFREIGLRFCTTEGVVARLLAQDYGKQT